MGQLLLAELTLKLPTSPVTSQIFGATNGREYLGANAPRIYRPRVLEFINFRRDAVDDGKTFGGTHVGGGVLRLANPDGFYDAWIDYGAGTARFLLVDGTDGDYDQAEELLTCAIAKIEFTLDGEVRVMLQDRSAETDLPLQTSFYAGTNSGSTGVEGLPDDLQGRPKVDALGVVFQAPLPWANEAALILQLDSERISAIGDGKVYDGLVGITRGSAHASLALLQASSPTTGTFDYYLGGSNDGAYIKLGDVPEYGVTADFDGKAPSGSFLTTPGELFDWVLQNRAGVDYTDISAADIDALISTAPYDLGLWIDEPLKIRDVLDRIAASIPGWWGVDRSGVYRLKALTDPALETAALTLKVIKPDEQARATDADIVAIELVATNDAGGGVPAQRVRVLYKHFPQVTDLGFDTAADPSLRAAAAQAWRSVTAEDASVADLHERAPTLEFETALTTEADAATVAAQLLSLYGVRRDRYRVSVRLTQALAAAVDLGAIVELQFDRFDLAAGKNFVVLGMRYRGFSENEIGEVVDLDIWG